MQVFSSRKNIYGICTIMVLKAGLHISVLKQLVWFMKSSNRFKIQHNTIHINKIANLYRIKTHGS